MREAISSTILNFVNTLSSIDLVGHGNFLAQSHPRYPKCINRLNTQRHIAHAHTHMLAILNKQQLSDASFSPPIAPSTAVDLF